MKKFLIGNRPVGKGYRPFIIAETGINHNGDLGKAYAMIALAKRSGADAVKFQTYKAEEFVAGPDQKYTYKSGGKTITGSMLSMFKKYEFKSSDWFLIKKRCDKEGITFLSTPQNVSDLKLLLEIGVSAVKIGSDDFTNIPLIKNYTGSGLPVLMSCGMADMAEICNSLKAAGYHDGYPVALLLCTSEYPALPSSANLMRLKAISYAFPDLILGFSDHTQGALASALAVAFGALIFEKHFTLDKKLPGPDHWFSEDPKGLKLWVDSIRTAYRMLGSGSVEPTDKERAMRLVARRSIVASREIKKGHMLKYGDISFKRPGSGLPAADYEKVIGKRVVRRLRKNSLIKIGDLE